MRTSLEQLQIGICPHCETVGCVTTLMFEGTTFITCTGCHGLWLSDVHNSRQLRYIPVCECHIDGRDRTQLIKKAVAA